MKVLILFFCWCILFVLSWPLAIIGLILAPFVWLVSLPFRLFKLCVDGALGLIGAVLTFPARLLGYRRSA